MSNGRNKLHFPLLFFFGYKMKNHIVAATFKQRIMGNYDIGWTHVSALTSEGKAEVD